MKYHFRKLYFEEYAAQTMKQYLKVEEVLHRERPDLEVPNLHMGIEVTQAIKEDMIFDVTKKQLYTPFSLNPFDRQTLFDNKDVSEYFETIQTAIQVKIKKSENYERFTYNGLYIFTHCFLLTKQNVATFFKTLPFTISFYDTIYLNGIEKLYCFDVHKQTLKVYTIASEDLLHFNVRALQYETDREREKEDAKAIKRKNAS